MVNASEAIRDSVVVVTVFAFLAFGLNSCNGCVAGTDDKIVECMKQPGRSAEDCRVAFKK